MPGAGVSGWYAPRVSVVRLLFNAFLFAFSLCSYFRLCGPARPSCGFRQRVTDRRPGRARSGRRNNGGASPGHSGQKKGFLVYSRYFFPLRFLSAQFVVIGRGCARALSSIFTHTLPARVPSPAKRDKGGLALLVRSHICRKYYFSKSFRAVVVFIGCQRPACSSDRRQVLPLPGPAPASCGVVVVQVVGAPRHCVPYFALCASVRGFILLQKETRPKASKAPGCSAERKARAVPLLYLRYPAFLFDWYLTGYGPPS